MTLTREKATEVKKQGKKPTKKKLSDALRKNLLRRKEVNKPSDRD